MLVHINIHLTFQTYCTDQMTTDSTASATAFLTGTKTKTGLIGLKDHVKRGGCDQQEENKLTSVLKYAHQAGPFLSLYLAFSLNLFRIGNDAILIYRISLSFSMHLESNTFCLLFQTFCQR